MVLLIVGFAALAMTTTYDGPGDIRCGTGSGGHYTCSDHAVERAEWQVLITGHAADTTVTSTPLVWIARIALTPVAAGIAVLVLAMPVSMTRRVADRLRLSARRRRMIRATGGSTGRT